MCSKQFALGKVAFGLVSLAGHTNLAGCLHAIDKVWEVNRRPIVGDLHLIELRDGTADLTVLPECVLFWLLVVLNVGHVYVLHSVLITAKAICVTVVVFSQCIARPTIFARLVRFVNL